MIKRTISNIVFRIELNPISMRLKLKIHSSLDVPLKGLTQNTLRPVAGPDCNSRNHQPSQDKTDMRHKWPNNLSRQTWAFVLYFNASPFGGHPDGPPFHSSSLCTRSLTWALSRCTCCIISKRQEHFERRRLFGCKGWPPNRSSNLSVLLVHTSYWWNRIMIAPHFAEAPFLLDLAKCTPLKICHHWHCKTCCWILYTQVSQSTNQKPQALRANVL